MVQSERRTLVPIFLPHLGCSSRCVYCNQSFITGLSDKKSLGDQIEASLAGRTEPVEVALYSGNIFGLPEGELLRLFDAFDRYRPLIGNIRISTKPVPLEEKTLDILKRAGVTIIELGMPSFNDDILASLDRGYNSEEFYRSYRHLEEKGFILGLQIMIGLPGETEADIESMAAHLSALRPSLLRIYPLLVLEGTRLHQMFEHKEFLPLDLDTAVKRSARLYLHALREGITVIRMGLSGNEVLQEHVIAGPYHPSFGFLVKAQVFLDAVMQAWKDLGQPGHFTVTLRSSDIPHLIGHKRRHLERFKELGARISWETGGFEKGCFRVESKTGWIERSVTDGA